MVSYLVPNPSPEGTSGPCEKRLHIYAMEDSLSRLQRNLKQFPRVCGMGVGGRGKIPKLQTGY